MRNLCERVHQRTAIPRPRKGSRRLLDDAPRVNSRWRPSLRAFSASTPSSASRSRPAPPVSSPGACPSSTSCSTPPARTRPSRQPGCFAAAGARWPMVPASRRLAAPCPARCSAPVEANRYRLGPARATPRLAAMLSATSSLIRSAMFSAMSFMGAQLMFVHTPCQSTATPCLSAGRSSAPAKRNRRPRDLDREHSRRRCHAASSSRDRTLSLSGAIRLRHSRTPASASALVRLPVPPRWNGRPGHDRAIVSEFHPQS